MEDKIRLHARDHIARFADKGSCEFMGDFAFEFPIRIFLELMGLHFLHLATHPEDQARLRANPAEITGAINEMMRAYGSISVFRTCKEPVEVNGVQFMPGDKVAMSATLGGRDPDEFPDPAEVRFNRRTRHFNFGYGTHGCLGRHLALREMRIAMEEFLSMIPTFRVIDGHVVHYHLGLIQPVKLPLVW